MANFKITELTSIAGSIDRTTDVLEVVDTSANQSKKATVNQLLSITGDPVGTTDTQAVTNKTVGNTNTVTLKDTLFTLQDDGDTSKQAKFELSGLTTATTRTYTLPNASSTLVDLSTAQTLTSKTLTSPVINTATISNPTLTVDTVSEFTGANGVTVDGLNIKDGKLNTNNSVVTSNLTDDAVTDAKMDYPRWWHEIARTTLGGAGDTISVTSIPARKYLMIVFSATATGGTNVAAIRFNNDSGANYATRISDNGGADATSTSATSGIFRSGTVPTGGNQTVTATMSNIAAVEKIYGFYAIGTQTATGAGTAAERVEGNGKWANTADQISRVDVINTGTGDFAIGSEVIILGHD